MFVLVAEKKKGRDHASEQRVSAWIVDYLVVVAAATLVRACWRLAQEYLRCQSHRPLSTFLNHVDGILKYFKRCMIRVYSQGANVLP